MTDVVAGCIFKDNRFLLARRKFGKFKGKWEFPGGKRKSDETLQEALKREILEELFVEIEVLNKIGENSFYISDNRYILHLFKCLYIEGSFVLTDHDKIEWINANDLSDFDLMPADKAFVGKF